MSTYDDASLIVYPSGYKANKIYSLKPTDGSGDLTFARASTATRVNESGLIESVASGVPRIDYTGGGCGSLLLEKQSTNVVTYSNDFSNAAWTKVNSTITANDTTSPDGTQNASRLVISSSGYLLRQYTASVSAGGSWALSIFAKNQITNFLRFGGATPSGTDTYSIQDMGNGWYRHLLVRTFASANASFNLQYLIGEVGTNYIYGAQAEASYPTSYIPTQGSQVTRVAEVATKSGISTLIGQTEGTIYIEAALFENTTTQVIIGVSDGTTGNRVVLSNFAGTFTLRVDKSFVIQAGINGAANVPNVYYKIAARYENNNFTFYINGVKQGEDLSGDANISLTDLDFSQGTGANPFFGNIKQAIVFPTALTDTELATLTTI